MFRSLPASRYVQRNSRLPITRTVVFRQVLHNPGQLIVIGATFPLTAGANQSKMCQKRSRLAYYIG
jgi:uncharacterized protein (DUF1800 family)